MRNLILLLAGFLVQNVYSQFFEGQLEYIVNTKIIGDSTLDKSKLIDKLINNGDISNDTLTCFFSKKGDYATISSVNNIDIINTYLSKDNLIYHFVGDFNIVTAVNTKIDIEEKLGTPPIIKLLEDKIQIGDYVCSIVEIIWKTGKYRFYYSNSILKIDPDLFKNYNYDQFYKYLCISKALPIKIEMEINNFYKSTYELYSYREEEIDNSIFEIPNMKEDRTLSKMYLNKRVFVVK